MPSTERPGQGGPVGISVDRAVAHPPAAQPPFSGRGDRTSAQTDALGTSEPISQTTTADTLDTPANPARRAFLIAAGGTVGSLVLAKWAGLFDPKPQRVLAPPIPGLTPSPDTTASATANNATASPFSSSTETATGTPNATASPEPTPTPNISPSDEPTQTPAEPSPSESPEPTPDDRPWYKKPLPENPPIDEVKLVVPGSVTEQMVPKKRLAIKDATIVAVEKTQDGKIALVMATGGKTITKSCGNFPSPGGGKARLCSFQGATYKVILNKNLYVHSPDRFLGNGYENIPKVFVAGDFVPSLGINYSPTEATSAKEAAHNRNLPNLISDKLGKHMDRSENDDLVAYADSIVLNPYAR